MYNNNFDVFNDTKLLRHEQTVEISQEKVLSSKSKQKKIIVCLTAKDSDLIKDPDNETMDLNKKN